MSSNDTERDITQDFKMKPKKKKKKVIIYNGMEMSVTYFFISGIESKSAAKRNKKTFKFFIIEFS